jgi:ABC-type multidrug transport system fused ATPase/permease subunit
MAVIMLRLYWSLTLLALGVGPVLLVAIAWLNARIGAAAARARQGESQVYSAVQQAMA